MKKFLKENLKFIIFLILLVSIVNIELPYYIEAPGGTINLSKRIDPNYNKKNGSLNMLYVTEYKGNIVTVLLSKIIKSWDLYEIKNQQVSNEDANDIYQRNKVMLDNSIQNATLVAYKYANKKITIKEAKNIVIATTKDNGLKIGDIIISIDNLPVTDITVIKKHLETLNVNDTIKLIIKRNNKEKELTIPVDKDKLLGVMMVTNYEYETEEPLNINFKSGEGGSSGGLVLTLGIYSEITGIDLLKGRNIAGTGTIDIEGNVGEIDGIKYKIAGAVKNKMDLILVSPYNYEEAKKVVKENNYKIELVCVKTFEEAINYLTK
ncbi:MAG: S16 family serine protease [Mycoplasmatota bacterium]|nr:S16 family serine protease [Mycoplasmatota bacterium]